MLHNYRQDPILIKKISDTQVQYAHLLRKLTSLYNRTQLTFYLNAGVKEDALGES